jgi:hypothetical protein
MNCKKGTQRNAINGQSKTTQIMMATVPLRHLQFGTWENLVGYENERFIINTHIDNIMKLPSLTSENASQLRQIVDATKCNLEALKAMKQNTNSWDMIIIYI